MRGMICLIMVSLLFAACAASSEKPLPIPVMKTVMWDMMKVDEWYTTISLKDSVGKFKNDNFRMYEKVFSIHGITREKFYNSYRFYEAHPAQMRILIDSIDLFSVRERARLFEQNHGQGKKQ